MCVWKTDELPGERPARAKNQRWIVCCLIAGTPQPVITEHNTLFMRQEWDRKLLRQVLHFVNIFSHTWKLLKETLTQSRGHQGKAGDGEDGEGHDVDECVMDLTDVSVGRLSCFYIIYSSWSIWDVMEVHPISSSELIAEECLDLLSLKTISIFIV